ncbi:hypothetical protein NBRC116594_27950 [Shimia sp. NS0008-38b]|uniref:GNAT family N-acetyltransferase n=1 Tax=Shimia sp. NS0008-38b TaxID=3127653 RepID=UPI0031080722
MSNVVFKPLAQTPRPLLIEQLNDARVIAHLPLLHGVFDDAALDRFLEIKAARWEQDGLGHWAFWRDGVFLGWGGFEKEDDVWDFGLVLMPDAFGQGAAITRQALAFARTEPCIDTVQFLLAPTRRSMRALQRIGAREAGEIRHGGQIFRRFLLNVAD